MRAVSLFGVVAILLLPFSVSACWVQAGQRYGVSPQLLHAMARVESGLDPRAVNRSHLQRTGSYDIGLLQINSSNLPALARFGISENDLYSPCTNIHVGAWLLAQTLARQGQNWDGVGAYNAACTQLKDHACRAARSTYAWRVFRRLPGQGASPRAQPPATPRSGNAPVAATAPAPLILSARVTP